MRHLVEKTFRILSQLVYISLSPKHIFHQEHIQMCIKLYIYITAATTPSPYTHILY